MDPNDIAPAQPLGMTDLEEALRGSDGRAVASSLIERFTTLIEAYSLRIKTGLAPDEFKRAEAILGALASAREIVLAFPKG
jgi:hypothetical protein